jgi:hypothetical protein
MIGNLREHVGDVAEREPDRIGESAFCQPVKEGVSRPRSIDTDQDLPTRRLMSRKLRHRLPGDGDVVGGGVRSRVAGSQHQLQRLPGPVLA